MTSYVYSHPSPTAIGMNYVVRHISELQSSPMTVGETASGHSDQYATELFAVSLATQQSLFRTEMTVMQVLAHRTDMPDSMAQLGLKLVSTKIAVDEGQLLTDDQLDTVRRGFEEGSFKESKHAAEIVSKSKMTKEVWGVTSRYIYDILDRASTAGTLGEDLPKAACTAARTVAKTSSNTSIEPVIQTDLGESLVRHGTSDGGNPWLTTAGVLLLSAGMDTADYDPSEEITKRVAEHLLSVSKKTDKTREANLAAAGYSMLGRTSGGDHARTLVSESIEIGQYLRRTEPNLRKGFVRFVARLAEESPSLLEPYTVELAPHLRAESFAVIRDAARAFSALCGEVDWVALQPGVLTLDGAFENDGPMIPVFALKFLHQVAEHDREFVPTRVGDTFTTALNHDERFMSRYGCEENTDDGLLSRPILFGVLSALAPQFPKLVEVTGNEVFEELLDRPNEKIESFVSRAGGCFTAVNPNVVGEQFIQFLVEGVSTGDQQGPMEAPYDDALVQSAIQKFVTEMSEFEEDKALTTANRLVTLAKESEGCGQLFIVGSVLLMVHQERGDDELETNFQYVFERITDSHEGEFIE